VSVHVDDSDARRRIDRLALFLTDLRAFWPMLVPVATGWWRQQFESEGGFAGQPWASLSPSYAAWKSAHYPGKPILQATGAMRQAASRPERFTSPISLTLTITDPKIAYHEEGTGRMPARPLVFGDPVLPVAAQEELQAVADAYIHDLLGRI
jgi:hypothetical protein